MPTGYTQAIQEGISFEKFVFQCARAFGALIEMRDDPMDAPLPDEFPPSTYHETELAKAKEKLQQLNTLSTEELYIQSEAEYRSEIERWEKANQGKLDIENKYKEMLAKVVQWEPPSKEHQGLKDFMIQQIRSSIEWDCTPFKKPEKLDAQSWLTDQNSKIQWSIDYHTKEAAEEKTRSERRTQWVQQLKASMNEVAING